MGLADPGHALAQALDPGGHDAEAGSGSGSDVGAGASGSSRGDLGSAPPAGAPPNMMQGIQPMVLGGSGGGGGAVLGRLSSEGTAGDGLGAQGGVLGVQGVVGLGQQEQEQVWEQPPMLCPSPPEPDLMAASVPLTGHSGVARCDERVIQDAGFVLVHNLLIP